MLIVYAIKTQALPKTLKIECFEDSAYARYIGVLITKTNASMQLDASMLDPVKAQAKFDKWKKGRTPELERLVALGVADAKKTLALLDKEPKFYLIDGGS